MIIRHGEKKYNNNKGPEGCKQLDPELTGNGMVDAYEYFLSLKEDGINFNCIFTSPLRRARDTALIANKVFGCKVVVLPFLGEWFGHCNPREEDFHPETLEGYRFLPRRESFKQMQTRAGKIKLYPGCLYVSHGIVIENVAKMSYNIELSDFGYLRGFTI